MARIFIKIGFDGIAIRPTSMCAMYVSPSPKLQVVLPRRLPVLRQRQRRSLRLTVLQPPGRVPPRSTILKHFASFQQVNAPRHIARRHMRVVVVPWSVQAHTTNMETSWLPAVTAVDSNEIEIDI